MNNYFRITGYDPNNDFSFIIDSNGIFEKLWQFSAFIIEKGLDVIEASKLENIIDVNISQIQEDKNHIALRATADGKPKTIEKVINGIKYKALQIADKIYISNKEEIY